MNPRQQERIAQLVSQPIKWQCELSHYTSFAIGGPAEALVTVTELREVQPLLGFLALENIPWRIIGKGTNLLVRDEGFPGVIVRFGGELAAISEQDANDGSVIIRAGGGASFARLARRCSEQGLTGLEFACSIPGTVGGAVIMNAGAWGRDLASVLRGVQLMTAGGEIDLFSGDLDFTYRCWQGFAAYRGKAVVVAVELTLPRGNKEAILAYCRSLQEKRTAIQPNEYASAGSFFKNPPHDSAGRLIEMSGLKGLKIGGAMVSEKHGNFLVNTGGATAADVLRLMKIVQDTVERDCGVCLEPEVHFI